METGRSRSPTMSARRTPLSRPVIPESFGPARQRLHGTMFMAPGASRLSELYWDRNGRVTAAEQLLTAVTSTLEYRIAVGRQTGILRLEYRFDRSTGSQGGYFARG